jgi:hypothetical protein
MGNCARDTLFEHAIVTTKPPSSLLWRLHCKVYNRSYYRVFVQHHLSVLVFENTLYSPHSISNYRSSDSKYLMTDSPNAQ